jgi:hypothetical protein
MEPAGWTGRRTAAAATQTAETAAGALLCSAEAVAAALLLYDVYKLMMECGHLIERMWCWCFLLDHLQLPQRP